MLGCSINLCGLRIARRDLRNTNRRCQSRERNVQTYSAAIFQPPRLACIAWNEVELTMNNRYLEWRRRELSEGTVPSFGCGDQGNPWQTWTKCSWADSRVKVWKFFIVSGTDFVPIFRMRGGVSPWKVGDLSHLDASLCPRTFCWSMSPQML
jgi:hypothetical protein